MLSIEEQADGKSFNIQWSDGTSGTARIGADGNVVIDRPDEKAFEEVVARYRGAAVKPAFPEEARRFKVQAEAAVGRKEFAEAAARYWDALVIAPWWPEGHFNRALILGEEARYYEAIAEMKKYLALAPEASDARAAQDKVYEWEALASRKK